MRSQAVTQTRMYKDLIAYIQSWWHFRPSLLRLEVHAYPCPLHSSYVARPPRGGIATPLPAPLPEPGSVMISDKGTLVPHSPSPPTLLASCETSQTKSYCPRLTVVNYWQKLPCRPTWHKFQPHGTQYTLHSTHRQYTHLAGPLWVLWQNLRSVAPNQEKPHTTPFFFIYL
jgi:hypothetical protein